MAAYVPSEARAILEVGCGTGTFAAVLRRQRPGVELVGVEPDPESATQARAVFDRVVVDRFPEAAHQVRRDGGYDAVIFNDVLEHMIDPVPALDAARELLAPAGTVVASIPNVRHISATAPLVFRGEWRYQGAGILDESHLRFYTARSIRRLFADHGWTIHRLEPINRVFRFTDGRPRWWVRLLGIATLGASDAFFILQYAVTASPSR